MCETKEIITEEARFYASKTIKKIYWYVFFFRIGFVKPLTMAITIWMQEDTTRCVSNIL